MQRGDTGVAYNTQGDNMAYSLQPGSTVCTVVIRTHANKSE